MKKHPGSFSTLALSAIAKLFLILWGVTMTYAEDFTSKFSLSTSTPYVKEAVIMKLDLVQTDHSKVILFKFTLQESDDYEFYRLDMQEEDAYHSAKVHYTYLIYPKRAGEIHITFDLIEMVTTDEKVAFSFSGDRDNVRGLNKIDIPISLPPLKLQVKALPKDTQIVGDFTLQHTIKKDQADSFEPLPLSITLKGIGYPPILKNMIPKNTHYTLFSEKAIVQSSRGIQGTQSSITYPYALSAKESFDLSEITIHAFNPKTKSHYLLTIPKKHFTITQPNPETLVDKTDSPKPLQNSWGWLGSFLGCLIVFVAGFLTAKLLKWNRFSWKKSAQYPYSDSFTQEVKATNDPKTLLRLLIAADAKRYSGAIEKLEKHLYRKVPLSINHLKKELFL